MPIPAIVLTCQKYSPLTDHMISCYERVWPDNPLKFYLPSGSPMQQVASRHAGKVELIDTGEGDERGKFKAAVLGLLKGLKDEEWVYWCPDDKYPLWLDQQIALQVVESLSSMPINISGLCLVNRKIDEQAQLTTKVQEAILLGRNLFIGRQDYKRIWLHQFIRVGIIRHLFGSFPETIGSAKEMDALHQQINLPPGRSRYFLKRNAMVLGESTHRGMITANCAKSLKAHQGIPEGFKLIDQHIIIGKRPWASRLAIIARKLF